MIIEHLLREMAVFSMNRKIRFICVFPAYAGVIPPAAPGHRVESRLSRIRGGDPVPSAS